jgi:hypothetical protein
MLTFLANIISPSSELKCLFFPALRLHDTKTGKIIIKYVFVSTYNNYGKKTSENVQFELRRDLYSYECGLIFPCPHKTHASQ